jgi:CRP-like cAMP-binding protein
VDLPYIKQTQKEPYFDRPQYQHLLKFFEAGRPLRYQKGEVLLHAGEVPRGVYLLTSGYIKVYTISDEGVENLHLILTHGQLFPLIWAFKNQFFNVYYEALTPVTVYVASREDFLKFCVSNTASTHAVLHRIVDQFYVVCDRLDNLEYGNAHDRVVYILLFLASRFGIVAGNKVTIDPPLTHNDIANSVRLSRETVSRIMEKLQSKKLLRSNGRKIVIEDICGLEQEVGEIASPSIWSSKASRRRAQI